MRALQEQKLTRSQSSNLQLHWHNSISEIAPSSSEYTMLVAHEFFDALPIHILQVCRSFSSVLLVYLNFEQKLETGWHEVLVAPIEEPSLSETEAKTEEQPSEIPPLAPTPSTLPGITLRRVLESKPSAASTLLGLSSERFKELPSGSTLEVSPTSFRIARKVGELLESGRVIDGQPSQGGCGLIVDYGGNKAYSNSFRVS